MSNDIEEPKRFPKPDDFEPEIFFPEGHDRAGNRRCTAWNKNKGQQCEAYPMKVTGHYDPKTKRGQKCNAHGGMSPRGLDHYKATTLKYSNSLPDKFLARYERVSQDPDFLSQRQEIHVVEARIEELFERISGGGPDVLAQIQDEHRKFVEAMAEQDKDKADAAIRKIGTLSRQGRSDYAVWEEIKDAIKLRSRLVESHRRWLLEQKAMITLEEAKNFYAASGHAFREILEKFIHDDDDLKAAKSMQLQRSRRLLSGSIRTGPDGGGLDTDS
jgi:hypothetical protein